MRTVAWLKAELAKFPDDAVCFAYEGEVTGIVIERSERRSMADGPDRCRAQGTIFCSESNEYDISNETILLPERT